MNYKHILVTGGAGFVGSTICLKLKEYYPDITVVALDNLMRRGSELNVSRLQKFGVQYVHGDVRNASDLDVGKVDLLIECSAEPSVMAGVSSSPEYLIDTNLVGAINCFELARRKSADVFFLSTSRVYPVKAINELNFVEDETRFRLSDHQVIVGASQNGIAEDFPLQGVRSLYGTTKLAAELVLQEYRENYGIKTIIDRFGVITGPWQMGKVDQGVIVLWMANHVFKKPLRYIGFGGEGKQVRDMIHVDDVFGVVNMQLQDIDSFDGEIYNVGGGIGQSVSLSELTKIAQQITGNQITISHASEDRPGDIRSYITDTKKLFGQTGWKPKKSVEQTCTEIYEWLMLHKETLRNVLG